jgi:hypothetical protein
MDKSGFKYSAITATTIISTVMSSSSQKHQSLQTISQNKCQHDKKT